MDKNKQTTFYYARISLVRTLMDDYKKSKKELEDELSKLFVDLVLEGEIPKTTKQQKTWVFGDVVDKEDYIYGKIGKIKHLKEKTQYDRKNKVFQKLEVEDEETHVSNFFFHKKNTLLYF